MVRSKELIFFVCLCLQAIQEIQNNYADLNYQQRRWLQIIPSEIIGKFVYEIGMMFDDDTGLSYFHFLNISFKRSGSWAAEIDSVILNQGYPTYGRWPHLACKGASSSLLMNVMILAKPPCFVCDILYHVQCSPQTRKGWALLFLIMSSQNFW